MAEMTLDEFLFKCSDVYPFDTKDADRIQRLLNEYKKTISEEIDKSRKNYNFEKLFEVIKKSYSYSKMPGPEFIVKKLPYAAITPPHYVTGDGQVLVCVLGKKDEEGNWSYSERNWVLSSQSGNYVGDVLKKLRASFNMVKEFTFPEGSGPIDHDRENRQFSIWVKTKELGEYGYPIEERKVFYAY